MKINRFLQATAIVGALTMLPGVAMAQATLDPAQPSGQVPTPVDTNTPTPEQAAAQDEQGPRNDIVVTGSRITTPNIASTAPITTVSAQEIQATATVSVGDVLNDLPQLQSTFSQANSTRFLGTSGLNLLDLYGLGTQRTLVLVNGRRHVGSDILNNAVSPDVNTFPTDLIERVDITTGGDSALYGSDAIAGVVNFVLKDHYDGIQLRTQGSISQHGDAGAYYGSLLVGKNFAQGRGNIAVNLEYARQNILYASDRKDLQRASGFVTVDSDQAQFGTTQPNNTINSDGNPDAVFYRDIRSGTLAAGGLFAASGGANALCGRDKDGRAFTCNYLFQPNGTLVPQTGTRVGLAGGTAATPSATPAGSFIGGNGDTRREGQLIQILPQLDRYSANLIGHFAISDAFVPFIEAKYVRTESFGQGSNGPAFTTGGTIDGLIERPRLDNPYLSAQARTVITNALIAGGANAAAITGATRFSLRKNYVDLGIRSEAARRETYRIVGGVRGDFNDDWHYELSGNYGEFHEQTTVLGNINQQRFLLALDSATNAAGQIVCRSQLPGAAGTTAANNAAGVTGDPSNLIGADVAACVPLNPFGSGSISAASRNYIVQDTTSRGKITQLDITGFVSGDLSQLFELPGGPIGFAVGGEYRRETNYYRQDPLVEAGYTFYNAIARFTPPAFEVKEAFGEVRLPLLKDLPFAADLTLTASGRYSDYNGQAGRVGTYTFGGTYAPIRDIVIRGTYSRAVRAPNLSELYSPQSQNFATVGDPCSAINIANGTQFRAANCLAAGIPASYDYRYAGSLEILSGGNPDLDVEKSDSYTAGILLQPRAIRGLSLSVDYYRNVVNNVITSVSAQGILDNCYDSPTLNNPFCGSFQRVGAGQTGPNGEEQFRVIEGSLLQSVLNFAKLRIRGINATVNYQHKIGSVDVNSSVSYTHQLENTSFTDPAQPDFGDNLLNEVGVPKDAVNWNINADFGPVFTNIQMRYLGSMAVGAVENHEAFQGRPAQNLDDYDTPFYPDIFYVDARLGFNIPGGGNFYIGADNLTDRKPPFGSTGIGGGTGIYEPVGRRFYAGVTAKF